MPVIWRDDLLKKLTGRQQQILDFLEDRIQATGMPPTRVEIASELGFRSPNAAEDHLKALARKGVVELIPGTSRGIRVVSPEPLGLPIVGSVAAGSPVLAVENIDERLQLSKDFFHPQAHYLLRVKGLSMKDAGILEGDLIAVNREMEPRNGDIVVARIDDDVTVKRLEKNRGMVELHPENPEFSVIRVDPERHEFAIEGVVVGLLRI
jgi:repressor LexA